MKSILKVSTRLACMSLMFVLGSAMVAFADAKPTLERRIESSRIILSEIMSSPDQSIPEELLSKCKAIAIYPGVVKGGFIFGGRFGKGVVLAKNKDGQWSPVAFSTIAGGSWGLQIGVQATDLILVIMNNSGLDALLSSGFTLGGGVSVAAGPMGRDTQGGTDLSLRAGILTYSRSKGLFAGLSLEGSFVTQDNGSNSAYYGKAITSRDILLKRSVSKDPAQDELIRVIESSYQRWKKRVDNRKK